MRVHGGNEDRHIGPGGGSGSVITVVKIVYSLYVSQVLHKNTGGGSGDVITVIAIDR